VVAKLKLKASVYVFLVRRNSRNEQKVLGCI